MNRKLIVLDIDNTITKNDGTISKRTIESIKRIKDAGNIVVLATSRPRYQALEYMNKCRTNEIVISSNGAEIYDCSADKIIYSSYMDKDEVDKLINYSYEYDTRMIFTAADFDYVTKVVKNDNQKILNKNNFNNKIKQCMVMGENTNKIKKQVSKLSKCYIVDEGYFDKIKWFSIINKDTSKGVALRELARYLNISIENTIAIGNDLNDISMLKEAGYSVVVDNAIEELKKMVDYVTSSNEDDGVAKFLETLQ